MSDTYLSEGNQIVLKEEFRNILVDFENDYFGTDTDVFEDYSNKLLELFNRVIADLETKLSDLQQEQIAEMKEHQETMELAENTITNLVEDNRASQEWYKKQLAESEEFLVATKWKVQDLNKQLSDTEEQNKRVLEKLELIVSANQELEQKLAEKDKELKQLKLDLGMYKSVNEFLNRYSIEKAREVLLQTEKAKKQLKIEFAIAELEKVKEFNVQQVFSSKPLDNFIDNQIKQLKEMK